MENERIFKSVIMQNFDYVNLEDKLDYINSDATIKVKTKKMVKHLPN
jgi:hypothetical protein